MGDNGFAHDGASPVHSPRAVTIRRPERNSRTGHYGLTEGAFGFLKAAGVVLAVGLSAQIALSMYLGI